MIYPQSSPSRARRGGRSSCCAPRCIGADCCTRFIYAPRARTSCWQSDAGCMPRWSHSHRPWRRPRPSN